MMDKTKYVQSFRDWDQVIAPLSLRGREHSDLTKQSPIVHKITSSGCSATLLAMTVKKGFTASNNFLFGKSLMSRTEEEARQMGAKNAYLDTFSFQAPGFYENLGYRSFGELLEFPPGQKRVFMKKQL